VGVGGAVSGDGGGSGVTDSGGAEVASVSGSQEGGEDDELQKENV